MDQPTAFVVCTIIGSLFMLLSLEVMSHNWFKKERFKFEVSNLKKQNDLQLKKMAREMGLSVPGGTPHATSTAGGGVGNLLELAKGLDPEQIGAIADILQGRLGGGEGEGQLVPEGIDGLVDFITKNPDIVQGFLSKAKEGLPEGKSNDGFL